VERIGVHDNFFDLGGHSLLLTQVMSRVREALQLDITLNMLFSGTLTVAGLAESIEQYLIEQATDEDTAALLSELNELSDEEVKELLATSQLKSGR
jgi:acyl carrier protein